MCVLMLVTFKGVFYLAAPHALYLYPQLTPLLYTYTLMTGCVLPPDDSTCRTRCLDACVCHLQMEQACSNVHYKKSGVWLDN